MSDRLTSGIPNPGSDEALSQGCRCPVLDNAHGRGYMGVKGDFAKREDCPLHGRHTWNEIHTNLGAPDDDRETC